MTTTPAWFDAAVAEHPERRVRRLEEVDVEILGWGRRGLPALLLLHGFLAHADWWSFLAPLLCQGRRVVACSLSGMGGSGRRDVYSVEWHAREALAVAEAEGLFEGSLPPIVIGHSYGSIVTRRLAELVPQRLGGVIYVDGVLPSGEPRAAVSRRYRHTVYPTLEQALARFRFTPAQTCDNPYLVDFIARRSLEPARDADGTDGWVWRFDPDLRAKMRRTSSELAGGEPGCRSALVFGARSLLMTPERLERLRAVTPADVPWVVIPDAGHHIMVDQPLALVGALRALIAAWQPEVGRPAPIRL